jgi:hypothetical protein
VELATQRAAAPLHASVFHIPELHVHILSDLPLATLARAATACRLWRSHVERMDLCHLELRDPMLHLLAAALHRQRLLDGVATAVLTLSQLRAANASLQQVRASDGADDNEFVSPRRTHFSEAELAYPFPLPDPTDVRDSICDSIGIDWCDGDAGPHVIRCASTHAAGEQAWSTDERVGPDVVCLLELGNGNERESYPIFEVGPPFFGSAKVLVYSTQLAIDTSSGPPAWAGAGSPYLPFVLTLAAPDCVATLNHALRLAILKPDGTVLCVINDLTSGRACVHYGDAMYMACADIADNGRPASNWSESFREWRIWYRGNDVEHQHHAEKQASIDDDEPSQQPMARDGFTLRMMPEGGFRT